MSISRYILVLFIVADPSKSPLVVDKDSEIVLGGYRNIAPDEGT